MPTPRQLAYAAKMQSNGILVPGMTLAVMFWNRVAVKHNRVCERQQHIGSSSTRFKVKQGPGRRPIPSIGKPVTGASACSVMAPVSVIRSPQNAKLPADGKACLNQLQLAGLA
jgi:hypothetical protein